MLPLPVRLEQTGSKQQRQVLGAHLVQIGTLLDPERGDGGTWLRNQESEGSGAPACSGVSSPVQVADHSCQRGAVDPRETLNDLLVAVQSLTLLGDF